jgi:DNA repair exonuclease SbcCD ATPase subunit
LIKSLKIFNFQSHKETEIEFHSGINIITGQSDSGKSAILRAIDWVVNNQPSGDSFRSNWGGETRVEIKLDDGVEIHRIKGKGDSSNVYKLLRSLGKRARVNVFKAFSSNVPDEIKDALNFSEINWQRQLDSPFLLTDSSGEVARKLNEIASLDSIDTALSSVNKMIRKNRQDSESSTEQTKNLAIQLREFDKLGKFETSLKTLERQEREVSRLNKEIASLRKLTASLETNEEGLIVIDNFLKIEEVVKKLEKLKRQISEQKTALVSLQEAVDRLKSQEEILKRAGKSKSLDETLSALETKSRKLKLEEEKSRKLSTIISQLRVKKRNLLEAEKTLESLESKIPDVCPECGQRIPK